MNERVSWRIPTLSFFSAKTPDCSVLLLHQNNQILFSFMNLSVSVSDDDSTGPNSSQLLLMTPQKQTQDLEDWLDSMLDD